MESQDIADIESLFAACSFGSEAPPTENQANAATTTLTVNSFYLDSAGRVQVFLPLHLKFASREALNKVLGLGCIQPTPSNWSNDGSPSSSITSHSLSVEARVKMTFGASEAALVTVESVSIESSSISNTDDTLLCLNVCSALRVAKQGDIVSSVDGVKLSFEVSAILTKVQMMKQGDSSSALSTSAKERLSLANGLSALYSGRHQESTSFPSLMPVATTRTARSVITKMKVASPVVCQVNILHAVKVSARTMNGPTMGDSWIAVEISHSNTHSLPVTIKNVTIHPAFSQAKTANGAVIESSGEIIDMSQNVQWRFLDEGNDNMLFPKTVGPNEAISTVLFVKAEEDSMCRTFACPISVATSIEEDAEKAEQTQSTNMETIVQGYWTSLKRATETSDSFRVDYSLPRTDEVVVGEIFSLGLSIHNLGMERKELKIKVLSRSKSSRETEESKSLVHEDDVVFENMDMLDLVLGDESTTGEIDFSRRNENQLLAVDDSFVLGVVNANDTAEAQIRFMPLSSGTLPLPYFDLLTFSSDEAADKEAKDDGSSTVHRCMHNLQISVSV